jgi:hypothetical protein
VSPATLLPLLITTEPLTPTEPPFADRSTTLPDDVGALNPDTIVTAPPDADASVWPAVSDSREPVAVVLEPTTTLTAPAEPPAASPLFNITYPLAPLAVVPEPTRTSPDAPDVVDGPDTTCTVPLLPAALPLDSTTAPLEPPAPPDTPVATVIAPDAAPAAPAVPELSTIAPLLPAVAAFADRIVTAPDDDTPPAPLTMRTTPPTLDVDVVLPASNVR